ncbi:hypothetical protein FBUS_08104 [Fasciolopsis buskii]|uniref:Uncharacterized protein n=1 Tax=Fasciolopsis buskii TaxID=27845 RepID=A0A8E0RLM7_9TREM|nr:hypothetical protein FBUS_08104 [Fasciolopsis buski]
MKQTEITQFTPHFEGFIASESDVVAQKDWYGYHGKIDVGGYGGDNLYVREITATGYSAFSFRKVPQVPEINQNSYFKVDTISGGLEIIWNFESLFLISYKNLLTSESLLVPVNNQRTGAHFLGDLDPCTPYEFQSYLPDTNQPNATQIVTIVMQPESEQEKYDPIWFSLSRYA